MTTCVLKAARVSVNWSLKNFGLGGTSEVSFTAHSSPHGSHHLLVWKPPGIGGKADVGHAMLPLPKEIRLRVLPHPP